MFYKTLCLRTRDDVEHIIQHRRSGSFRLSKNKIRGVRYIRISINDTTAILGKIIRFEETEQRGYLRAIFEQPRIIRVNRVISDGEVIII